MQGVGFRPHVHRLATSLGLCGSVRNGVDGVVICVQGPDADLDNFLAALTTDAPPLAAIHRISSVRVETEPGDSFVISNSLVPDEVVGVDAATDRMAFVPPDSATCDECLAELFDPLNRRYRYPFLNCTQCGPRFTIVRGLPYDRARTTLAAFPMCAACRAEYLDPADRRFHAQPTACADCGPVARLQWTNLGMRHQELSGGAPDADDPIATAARALATGLIVAIKGLGGYHIACDATNPAAVERLRVRKHRQDRPFAVMMPSVETIELTCELTPDERALLQSRERPIVLLAKRQNLPLEARRALDAVAPRSLSLGVMLPYTPLHHLLLAAVGAPLVMTSGNLSDEPIAFEDDDALERLSPLVDLFLTHDRPIATRCDDSVMRIVRGSTTFTRRSRGFSPRPVHLALPFPSHLLAVGGQLKSVFCLGRGHSAFLSHHIGDLENAAAYRSFTDAISHYSRLLQVHPQVVAHDLHAGYLSTQLAEQLDAAERIPVQHHHAHIASCMAEHGLSDPVIGVAFDGTGLGDDSAVWGGEFLVVDRVGYTRAAHLCYVPLLGGEAAIRRPRHMALSHAWAALGAGADALPPILRDRLGGDGTPLLRQMFEKGVSSPPTSSVGRLFDAVASLVGICHVASFEGQPAMELEAAADTTVSRSYEFDLRDDDAVTLIDATPVIRAITDDISSGLQAPVIAGAFHNSLVGMIVRVTDHIRQRTGVNRVALSGGVFQNALLATRAADALERAGFHVYTHRLVPCNDGGLSLGQAYTVALSRAVGQFEPCTDALSVLPPASAATPPAP